jgi:hypothetical protein
LVIKGSLQAANIQVNTHARIIRQDLRGAILCRAGKHADAVAELADVRDPVGLLFRALAEHGRGNKAACRTALAAAKKLIPPDKIDLIEQTPLPWTLPEGLDDLAAERRKRAK